MHAHLEFRGMCEQQCSGVIRVYDDGMQFPIDPYRCAIKCTRVAENEIELVGMTQPIPSKDEFRAVEAACKKAGLRVWVERKSGTRQGRRPVCE